MEVLGIDIGFGFTKATDGKETIIFKSISAETINIGNIPGPTIVVGVFQSCTFITQILNIGDIRQT